MTPVGFEPTVSAVKRPQTYALDRAATGRGENKYIIFWRFADRASQYIYLSN